jgi:hypothetical protein
MKKIALISILILIFTTALIKNNTKKIEDKIFNINENVRSLTAELGDVMLEFNYLSSPEKLIQYQSQYFENNLTKTDITKIKKIISTDKYLKIIDLTEKSQDNE